MKTLIELESFVEVVDQTMERAANDALDHNELWDAWRRASAVLPPHSDIPVALLQWWENKLLDASRRAFDHKLLRCRYHRGDYNQGSLPGDGLIWNSAPSSYRGREIRIELRRALQDGPWSASVTLGVEGTFAIDQRLHFPDTPDTPTGAFGVYASVIEAVKREIDRMELVPQVYVRVEFNRSWPCSSMLLADSRHQADVSGSTTPPQVEYELMNPEVPLSARALAPVTRHSGAARAIQNLDQLAARLEGALRPCVAWPLRPTSSR